MEEHIVASGIVHTNKSKRQLPETKEDPELLGPYKREGGREIAIFGPAIRKARHSFSFGLTSMLSRYLHHIHTCGA